MQIQETATPFVASPLDDLSGGGNGFGFEPNVFTANPIQDRIWRNPQPPGFGGNSLDSGGLNGILAQLSSLLQQLMAALSGGLQNFFTNAQGSSTGDPHLAFNGTTANGTQQSRFDSMTDHWDLLDSNSVRGGFRLSTDVTQPNKDGVTYNRWASVATNDGRTQVSLDNRGNAQVCRNGNVSAISAGQSIQLGPNEKVTRNADGSLVIAETAQGGATITTTFTRNGSGVDVSVDASKVELGGDLVRHS
ncbi:MAG TPA: hypothetical protein VGR69_05515 [Candidatus Rubrimentiphilum sp.]|nr:hypothetical protein [Candidatus Rubrimentiphilum sp.]